MDNKLKQLKVTDLKKILANAAVSHAPRATKADLIALIVANEAAQNEYKKQYEPAEVEEVTPEQVEVPEVEEVVTPEPAPAVPEPAPSAPEPAPETTSEPASTEPVDPELEKRKQRAARFGIPLVEPKKPPPPKSKKGAINQTVPGDNSDKLAARAARFGLPNKAAAATETASQESQTKKGKGNKRVAQVEPVDPEELERRKKRAERFGTA